MLKNEYNDESEDFVRGFLWRTVCLNSYKVRFSDSELDEVPVLENDEVDLSTQSLVSEANGTSFAALDVIKMDVDRLMIDPIFETEHVKHDVIQILYNYNKFTPYKQGYHEICGLIYLQLHQDGLLDDIKVTTFNIFTSLMLTIVPNFYQEDNLIDWCTSNFNRRLKLVDGSLYDLLIKTHKIESQVWLIRWVRLLLLRELGTENTVRILDLLLCYDHDLSKLIPFIIIIFLIKIKLQLVECEDNGEILHLLLHYPHKLYTNAEIFEIVDLSIKLLNAPEAKLAAYGKAINKRMNKEVNWDKFTDLDRIKMELKLRRRVKGMLKR